MSHERESEIGDPETYTLTIRIDAEYLAKIRIRRLGNGVVIVRPPPPPPRLRDFTVSWDIGEDLRLQADFELVHNRPGS